MTTVIFETLLMDDTRLIQHIPLSQVCVSPDALRAFYAATTVAAVALVDSVWGMPYFAMLDPQHVGLAMDQFDHEDDIEPTATLLLPLRDAEWILKPDSFVNAKSTLN